MAKLHYSLDNLEEMLPVEFSQEQIAKAKTVFFKKLALDAHKFYNGKIQVLPKAGIYGMQWFNVWYTPGVSMISTTIRDDNEASFTLSNRGNLVAVVSDSTRVLGDGNVTPPGGLGVMEGKAFLMKYLGGVDAIALCMDSRNKKGENDPDKIIDFVKMASPSFGAVNLEDISQPQCFKVLDELRKECDIPVWHDDAQGTAAVTLAGLINSIKLADKKLDDISLVFLGAGAANTTIANICIQAGCNPSRMILFDEFGALSRERNDIKEEPLLYKKWELCCLTNPKKCQNIATAMKNADVIIALSKPDPDMIKPGWIKSMAKKPIVFACANPVPEIYPYKAKEAGAFIVATGRGDFPNQVNNSIGFPGILKGALLVRAKTITDNMTIRAAYAMANFAEKRGITPENIIPNMQEENLFPEEAAEVAAQAVKDGVARINLTKEEAFAIARRDILEARRTIQNLMDNDFIPHPPREMLEAALLFAINQVK